MCSVAAFHDGGHRLQWLPHSEGLNASGQHQVRVALHVFTDIISPSSPKVYAPRRAVLGQPGGIQARTVSARTQGWTS